ncbi:ABC transporter ATP-binding protein [Georgenia yuyongxinii]|uniref:ABC transporter ATP-binding protein n=1 Tax=Georgenia yuyongxinii TaxID=2589797 RepID=A0A5B8C008_9MICO|nr:ABC transporter ATP-binding protein [Georgenia yuyongxinii]QDC23863.1 ABC transporter ATP-binding protein [Georgenia yuyongxinii]
MATIEDTHAAIHARDVGIAYGDFVAAENVNLTVQRGEFLCLLGPSGCGKSTLLSAFGGFVPISAGTLQVHDSDQSSRTDVGFVFQDSDALFGWLTVSQNISFGARMKGASRKEQAEVAAKYADLVGLSHCMDHFPKQLSGGMRQRLQLARVLANEPDIVLMDEPFGALDAQTREVMQRELARIWSLQGCTIVFVTHDIEESLLLADRIAIMKAGPASSIKSIHDVDLARPRDPVDPDFVRLHSILRQEIGAEVRKALRGQGLDEDLT